MHAARSGAAAPCRDRNRRQTQQQQQQQQMDGTQRGEGSRDKNSGDEWRREGECEVAAAAGGGWRGSVVV
ncbi:hypothetical protein CCHR01_14866 [Colletotrichum chrysophilum]|uniref:Uncharacterized protein n=1 Tax=Colletotrichum chrysophilum TaxID=1836956 RepID=A0AAD9A6P2_9PEZI|nr:hypothetical protein CCHR01_14866 [Colletotrichum chrysophilum]